MELQRRKLTVIIERREDGQFMVSTEGLRGGNWERRSARSGAVVAGFLNDLAAGVDGDLKSLRIDNWAYAPIRSDP